MKIKDLLGRAREIWGVKRMFLPEVVISMGKIFGDICRVARGAKKDQALDKDEELKKELGNMIFSSIRWADDLGYDPEECIEKAIKAQEKFEK